MPVFARDFHVSATASSLSLSLTTGLLAPAMIVGGIVSEARGRKAIMVASLFSSSLLMFVSAFAPRWELFLAALSRSRASRFAGLPAGSMAYLSEEVHPSVPSSLGDGTRHWRQLASAACAGGWRPGLLSELRVMAGGARCAGRGDCRLHRDWRDLSGARSPGSRPLHAPAAARSSDGVGVSWGAPAIPGGSPRSTRTGFILMGSLIATYNYVTYRLLAPPYSLRQSVVGAIFIVYLLGIVASAWAEAPPREQVRPAAAMVSMFALMLVGLGLTLHAAVGVHVILGITAVKRCGFFGGHSTTSAWIGLWPRGTKAQASALYMFFFYVGSESGGIAGWSYSGRDGSGRASWVSVTTLLFAGVTAWSWWRRRTMLVASHAGRCGIGK